MLDEGKIIDLTQPLYKKCPNFEGVPGFKLERVCGHEEDGFTTNLLSLYTHQGTHIDAKLHFFPGGYSAAGIPLSKCVGNAYLVDMSEKKHGSVIDTADLSPFSDNIMEGSRIVLRTGWDKKLPCKDYFRDFPSLTHEAAAWFADRRIALLGMDMPSPANPGKDIKEIHRVLLGADVVLVEALINLEQIHTPHFKIAALPLRLDEAEASPARVIAFL